MAIRAQLLDAERPTDLLAIVRQLTLLQIDPTAAVAPNADLVAWSRLGSSYRPAQLTQALQQDRTLFELDAMIRPMSDLPLYRADMAASPVRQKQLEWLRANDRFRRDILDRLAAAGPLLSRDIADTSAVAWDSTGWTNNRNVTKMLELLVMRGEVAIAGRQGRQRVWDLAERIYPTDAPVVPAEAARRIRDERRLRSLGIARMKAVPTSVEVEALVQPGEAVEVDGVPGTWRIDPHAITDRFEGRTALLSPFDRLVHNRDRALQLFDFDYVLEMYKPAAKRRWGFFALPILHHDALIGKLDATVDRRSGILRVDAIHEDVPFTRAMAAAVHDEIDALASWLEVTPAGPGYGRSPRSAG